MEKIEGEPCWISRARKEINQAEIPGDEDNPRIIEYHSVTTLKASHDEVPWCGAFACWNFEMEGIPSPKSAAAIDFKKWGVKILKPIFGCVVILKREDSSNPNARHVGFYVAESPGFIDLLGGNQKNRVCVQSFPISLVEEYRMPDPAYWRFDPTGEASQ